MYFMILGDSRAILEKPVHMVLRPASPTSRSFARVPLTHGLQLPADRTDAIGLCHLYHHLSTWIPPWESQARYIFQHNGFGGPFMGISESISLGQTQSLSGFLSNIFRREAGSIMV